MPDRNRDDPRERIQISPACFVPHILHVAFDDHQWIFVIPDQPRRQILLPKGDHFLLARPGVGSGTCVQTGSEMRFGGDLGGGKCVAGILV